MNSSTKGGANHGDHGPFVDYDEVINRISDNTDEVSGLMHAYWSSFITTGDPNSVPGRHPDRPRWPPYTPKKGRLVIFGEGNDEIAGGKNKGTAIKVQEDVWASEECKYWWDRVELFEGNGLRAFRAVI